MDEFFGRGGNDPKRGPTGSLHTNITNKSPPSQPRHRRLAFDAARCRAWRGPPGRSDPRIEDRGPEKGRADYTALEADRSPARPIHQDTVARRGYGATIHLAGRTGDVTGRARPMFRRGEATRSFLSKAVSVFCEANSGSTVLILLGGDIGRERGNALEKNLFAASAISYSRAISCSNPERFLPALVESQRSSCCTQEHRRERHNTHP